MSNCPTCPKQIAAQQEAAVKRKEMIEKGNVTRGDTNEVICGAGVAKKAKKFSLFGGKKL